MKFLIKNDNNYIELFDDFDFDLDLYIDFEEELTDADKKKKEAEKDDDESKDDDYSFFFDYQTMNENVKRRKIQNRIKKGITSSEKKNSLKRDVNNLFFQQFINLTQKNGLKEFYFNQFNIVSENYFSSFIEIQKEFLSYKDYESFFFLSEYLNKFNNFNFILHNSLLNLESIFDIKTKKNPKKLKLLKKFSHEIVFIPKQKRLKNVLRVFNLYSENFKNYNFWERIFWMFLLISLDHKKSFVFRRKLFIYKKSLKFFSRKVKK